MKIGWYMIQGRKYQMNILSAKYVGDDFPSSFLSSQEFPKGSNLWNNILKARGILQ